MRESVCEREDLAGAVGTARGLVLRSSLQWLQRLLGFRVQGLGLRERSRVSDGLARVEGFG